jgi:CRISPR-associated endoribonuclease Cas6
MRFKLTLKVEKEYFGNAIPINYQYELSAVIYKILSKSSEQYAIWLHDNGFELGLKRFKLFTFSRLMVPQYNIDKKNERLILQSD